MKKKRLITILSTVIIVAAIVFAIVAIVRASQPAPQEDTTTATLATDLTAFKEEYESLNATIRTTDGATYQSISIPDDAQIKYLTAAEAVEFVKQGTGILYVGANWCPWCRNAVPELLSAAKAYGKRTVYYVNLDDDKSSYEVQDGQLVQTKAGSEAYYELLAALATRLNNYILTDNGTEYDSGEKRIYMPYVVAIKDGEILSDHTGTVTLDDGQTKYDPLTSTQSQELFGIYGAMFAAVYGSSCDDQSTTPCE